MNRATELHLKSITAENLFNWREECFISFASSHNGKHNVELGVNGFGQYAIRYRDGKEYIKEFPPNVKEAIKRYTELISD